MECIANAAVLLQTSRSAPANPCPLPVPTMDSCISTGLWGNKRTWSSLMNHGFFYVMSRTRCVCVSLVKR